MNIDFGAVLKHNEDFLEHICTENTHALRAWKNLGPVSPQKIYREAFYTAVHSNLVNSMSYLLENPHFYNQKMYNEGMVAVCLFTHSQEMFDLLYPLIDADEVQRMLVEDGGSDQWTLMNERKESERLHTVISDSVSDNELNCPSRALKI